MAVRVQVPLRVQNINVIIWMPNSCVFCFMRLHHICTTELRGQRNNLRDFFFGPPCFSAKIELHFTLNYAAHVNQDVNRKVYTLAVSVGIPCKKYRCP